MEELIEHHRVRVEEITGLLKQEGAMDAYSTAKQMTWDMDYDSWDEFPLMQKWFASGEALAHLKHLELNGSVSRFMENNRFYFSIV